MADQDTFAATPPDELAAKRAEKAEDKRLQEISDLAVVLSTREGRRFLWRMLGVARLHDRSYTGNSDTFFNEGVRSVALWLQDEIASTQPEAFLQMQTEAYREGRSPTANRKKGSRNV